MSFSPSAVAVLRVLDTARATERRLDRAIASARGISFSEYRLLAALRDAPAATASRVALADSTGLTPSAVTRALKPLEKLGYVTTSRDRRDARRALATLTDHGVLLVEDAEAVIANVVDGITTFRVRDADAAHMVDLLGQ